MEINNIVLGLDIGGTKISAGLNNNGLVYDRKKIDTPFNSSKEDVLKVIANLIESYQSHHFQAIGIGIPGLVDPHQGIVYNLANIPSFQKVHLKEYLEGMFNVPVFINNDANCFTLGEYKFGPANQHQHVVGISLGTGVGTGIIANSALYAGYICGAGEWGGVPYLDKTFEDYCSSKFFRTPDGGTAKCFAKNARKNDQEALAKFEEYGKHIGMLIQRILFTFAPESIVLGGSISKAYPLFKDSMLATVKDFPYKAISDPLKIYVSHLEDVAILGAIALAEGHSLNAAVDTTKDTSKVWS
ncbi:MAG TPA: ROK family protein [Cyclobacteriaceae bacterium]|nr:ROK family protein [Cyclobacteriaceae bacterium]